MKRFSPPAAVQNLHARPRRRSRKATDPAEAQLPQSNLKPSPKREQLSADNRGAADGRDRENDLVLKWNNRGAVLESALLRALGRLGARK